MPAVKDTLGESIRSARINLNLTQGELARKFNVSIGYIKMLENSHRKPKYEFLIKIIRELNIQPDSIFYPEKTSEDSRIEDLIRMLYSCDERSLKVITATVKAALDSQDM